MTDQRRLAAVLFDMDGTLVDSEKIWQQALEELADRLGGNLAPAVRASMVGTQRRRRSPCSSRRSDRR